MAPTSRLYDALPVYLRQPDIPCQDARHVQTSRYQASGPDPQPALTSKRQLDVALAREFTVLKQLPVL